MPDIITVLFDIDGTIANTNEIILRTLADTLAMASGRAWRREELLPHWGLVLREQLRRCYPHLALHQALLAEFPGVRAMLSALQADGYTLGVVTSRKRAFSQLIVTEEDTAPRLKPLPDPLLYALQRLRALSAAAVYVGDNPDDIIAAHAAGMRAVAVGWSLRAREELLAVQPDAIIDTPHDLCTFLALASSASPAR